MKFYFSTRHIPQLSGLTLTERLAAIQSAERKLSGPEKLLLNLLKLLIVIPIFVLILQVAVNWMAIIWALLITLLYPLIIKPVHYGLCVKYIPKSHSQGD